MSVQKAREVDLVVRLKAWADGVWPASALEDDLREAVLEIETYREIVTGAITRRLKNA